MSSEAVHLKSGAVTGSREKRELQDRSLELSKHN